MPYQDIRKYFESHVKLITLVVFVINVLTLIIVLIILWAMPEPSTPVENCGYMCLKMEMTSDYMKCGCRAEILQEYTHKTFDEKFMTVSKEYKDMFKSSTVKVYEGYIGDVKPVAHLIGEERDKPTKGNAQHSYHTDTNNNKKKYPRIELATNYELYCFTSTICFLLLMFANFKKMLSF
ncbi:uncharacterized protein LOC127724945 [Mytilus californianus]|uniref:uncharacterized protein LOC127724945 n=1 Tax=Mytilus californianus TaxID=6549 RepID=UPI0022485970|nr:uncharacterized protein LOC127724945 [Mytilus californianus]